MSLRDCGLVQPQRGKLLPIVDHAFVTVVTPNVNAANVGTDELAADTYSAALHTLACSLNSTLSAHRPLIILEIGFGMKRPWSSRTLAHDHHDTIHVLSIRDDLFSPTVLACISPSLATAMVDPSALRAARGARRGTFQKLLVWGLEGVVQRSAVYLDGDTLAAPANLRREAPSLFAQLEMKNASFSAVGFPHSQARFYFNSGIMLLRPAASTMRDLAELLLSGAWTDYDTNPSEQDLLITYWASHPMACTRRSERTSYRFTQSSGRNATGIPQGHRKPLCAPSHSFARLEWKFNCRPQSIPLPRPAVADEYRGPSDCVFFHYVGEPKPWQLLAWPGAKDASGRLRDDAVRRYAAFLTRSRTATPRSSAHHGAQAKDSYYAERGYCERCLPPWALRLYEDTATACITTHTP